MWAYVCASARTVIEYVCGGWLAYTHARTLSSEIETFMLPSVNTTHQQHINRTTQHTTSQHNTTQRRISMEAKKDDDKAIEGKSAVCPLSSTNTMQCCDAVAHAQMCCAPRAELNVHHQRACAACDSLLSELLSLPSCRFLSTRSWYATANGGSFVHSFFLLLARSSSSSA